MMQIHRIAILAPLAAGLVAVICTIMIHALPLSATVDFVRRERKLGRAGTNFWIDMGIVVLVILCALAAHLLEIALWAGLYLICGEFADFGTAYYHSAVNYTSLGYGDLIMSPSWKLLGPLETANGMLLFGVLTNDVYSHDRQHLLIPAGSICALATDLRHKTFLVDSIKTTEIRCGM